MPIAQDSTKEYPREHSDSNRHSPHPGTENVSSLTEYDPKTPAYSPTSAENSATRIPFVYPQELSKEVLGALQLAYVERQITEDYHRNVPRYNHEYEEKPLYFDVPIQHTNTPTDPNYWSELDRQVRIRFPKKPTKLQV